MNIKTAARAAQMCGFAYNTPPWADVVRVGTAKCIIARSDGVVWLAVEGTRASLVDWLKNFWTLQSDFLGLRVHSGCAHEAELLLPGVLDILRSIEKPFELRITGHSQGGGVASLLAWALEVRHDYRVACGVGLAPMRSILKSSAATFNAEFKGRWFSIARQSDIVPHVPPAIRYGNTGEGWFIDGAGNLRPGIPSPLGYLLEVGRLAYRRQLPEVWADHSVGKYTEDLQRQIKPAKAGPPLYSINGC